ncbi:UNVERIFIED_CONTAM: hypothetical protein FKN15_011987 [Acipenser sinensis]
MSLQSHSSELRAQISSSRQVSSHTAQSLPSRRVSSHTAQSSSTDESLVTQLRAPPETSLQSHSSEPSLQTSLQSYSSELLHRRVSSHTAQSSSRDESPVTQLRAPPQTSLQSYS